MEHLFETVYSDYGIFRDNIINYHKSNFWENIKTCIVHIHKNTWDVKTKEDLEEIYLKNIIIKNYIKYFKIKDELFKFREGIITEIHSLSKEKLFEFFNLFKLDIKYINKFKFKGSRGTRSNFVSFYIDNCWNYTKSNK